MVIAYQQVVFVRQTKTYVKLYRMLTRWDSRMSLQICRPHSLSDVMDVDMICLVTHDALNVQGRFKTIIRQKGNNHEENQEESPIL